MQPSVDGHPSNLGVVEGCRNDFAVLEVYWLINRAEQWLRVANRPWRVNAYAYTLQVQLLCLCQQLEGFGQLLSASGSLENRERHRDLTRDSRSRHEQVWCQYGNDPFLFRKLAKVWRKALREELVAILVTDEKRSDTFGVEADIGIPGG